MPDTTVTARYYPTLSTVVTLEELPASLGFLKELLAGLLDKVHYKDLQYSKSPYGDRAFYSLKIVSKNRLEFELPGTGIFLVLNPGLEDGGISSFPITVQYQWPVLAYLRSFDLDGFDFSIEAFYGLALQVLKVSDAQIIASAINHFAVPETPDITPVQQFVDDVNDTLGGNIAYPTSSNPAGELVAPINALLVGTEQESMGAGYAAFSAYVLDVDDLDGSWQRLKRFFRSLLPTDDIEAYIRNMVIPKFAASLELSAAIEFPRSMLQPIHLDTLQVIPVEDPETGAPRAGFLFAEAYFYMSTEAGFQYSMDIALTSLYPAMIGNTGIIVYIQRLKVDLSETRNIPEAELDGRPDNFMGVYVQYMSVVLPPRWFTEEEEVSNTLRIAAYNLLVGTGGISGTLALEVAPIRNTEGEITDYYRDYFEFVYPIRAVSGGAETALADHNALVTYINTLPSEDFDFRYPLKLTLVGGSAPKAITTQQEYYSLLRSLKGEDEFMWFRLGGNPTKSWRLGFNRFDLTFRQNAVTSSNLKAALEIPKLSPVDGEVGNPFRADVTGHLKEDGDFSLAASFPMGSPANLFNFLQITFETLELGREDDDFFIGTECRVKFINPVMDKIFQGQEIDLPALRIYSNGRMEIVGGTMSIPVNVSINLGPIDMAITTIHFGSTQLEYNGQMRKYNYLGFDGALSLDPIGLDLRGDGIKYYYTVDNDEYGDDGDNFIRIRALEVDLIIPGNASPERAMAIINGAITIPEPGESKEYMGLVSIDLPKARISGGAAMQYAPRHPAFLLNVGIDLPTPLPLAATGLGFYAFGGLLGFRYIATKEAIPALAPDATWYDYFTYPRRGVNVDKFATPEDPDVKGFSIGAGTVLATMGDDGRTFSTRVMAILSLPSVFILDGRADVLSKRLGILDTSEPPFFAGLAIGDSSVEFWFGADYELPKNKGWLIDLYAEVQAGFFFNNPSAWYINFGTRDRPIQVTLFKGIVNLKAQGFLMLSASGIEAGGRVDFQLKKNFFGIKVELSAYVEVGGFISFHRPQMGGYLSLGGRIKISVWKIVGFSVSIDTILSVEVFRPFLIFAEVKVRVCIRIIVKICKSFRVKLKWERDKQVDRTPIPPLPVGDSEYLVARKDDNVKGIHMLTEEVFDLDHFSSEPSPGSIQCIVPLDTYIDIQFVKGLIPNAVSDRIGGATAAPRNYTDLIPPERRVRGGHELRQVAHKYSIEDIAIKAWSGNNWVDYHPFEAAVPAGNRPEVGQLRYGYWQRKGEQYDILRILATTPFDYMKAGESGWFTPEQYGISPSELFCTTSLREEQCMDVLNKALGIKYYPPSGYPAHNINGVYFNIFPSEANITNENDPSPPEDSVIEVTDAANNHGHARSLAFDNGNTLEILLPKPSAKVKLKLTTETDGVNIRYYESLTRDERGESIYQLVHQEYKASEELQQQVVYEGEKITRVLVVPEGICSYEYSGAFDELGTF